MVSGGAEGDVVRSVNTCYLPLSALRVAGRSGCFFLARRRSARELYPRIHLRQEISAASRLCASATLYGRPLYRSGSGR